MQRRWVSAIYLALLGAGIWSPWSTTSLPVLRGCLSALFAASTAWFPLWRGERRRRDRAERARQQGNEPCPRCQHYACDGVECITCDGPCTSKLTGPVDHASYWLN